MRKKLPALEDLWAQHQGVSRDPRQIVAQWKEAAEVDFTLLHHHVNGAWWEILEAARITLLITREYEHIVMALCVANGKPRVSYLPMPHPSGMALDPERNTLHLASTRNPNMVYEFAPCSSQLGSSQEQKASRGLLLPRQARYFPGCLYLHDLVMLGKELYGAAVGMNAIVRFPAAGGVVPAWWPACIENDGRPRFDKNFLQLNSIAAGRNLASSFFTASAAAPSSRRPGQRHFPVDGQGVVFSGKTRDVVAGGLTRPHSLRFQRQELWVLNSGYGQLGRIDQAAFSPLLDLPGWTRGLCFHGALAFVGTSRVLPRFRNYAPGLEVDRSVCGVHIIDMKSAKVLGSLCWPMGNQIFAIEVASLSWTQGFPFTFPRRRSQKRETLFFFRGQPLA